MSTRQKLAKYGTLLSGYGLGIFFNQGINLILITIFLMAIQSINNLIIDWGKDKQKAYDPVKDLK